MATLSRSQPSRTFVPKLRPETSGPRISASDGDARLAQFDVLLLHVPAPKLEFQLLISNFLPPAFTFRLTTFLNYAIYSSVILTKLISGPAPNSFPCTLLSPTLALTPFSAHSYSIRPPSISGSLHQSNPLFSYSSAFSGTRFFHCFPRFSSTFSCIQRPASHPSDSVPPALRTACPELVEGSLSKGARPNHPADRNFSLPSALAGSLSSQFPAPTIGVIVTTMPQPASPACSPKPHPRRKSLPPTSIKSLSQLQIYAATTLFSKFYRDFTRNPSEIITYLFLPPTYRNFAPSVSYTYGHSPRQRFWNDNLVDPPPGGTSTFAVP